MRIGSGAGRLLWSVAVLVAVSLGLSACSDFGGSVGGGIFEPEPTTAAYKLSDWKKGEERPASPMDAYNVSFGAASKIGPYGSMPLGNGNLGLNVWVDQTKGDLVFFVAKGDAWDNASIINKIGRIRIEAYDADAKKIMLGSGSFDQTLDFATGQIGIKNLIDGRTYGFRIWADAIHQETIYVESGSEDVGQKGYRLKVSVETWRNNREIKNTVAMCGNVPVKEGTNVVLAGDGGTNMIWYLRNQDSVVQKAYDAMKLSDFGKLYGDPLKDLTSGGIVTGTDMQVVMTSSPSSPAPSSAAMMTRKGRDAHLIQVQFLTRQQSVESEWTDAIKEIARRATGNIATLRTSHRDWWGKFWDRSYIRIASSSKQDDGFRLSQLHAISRFMAGAAGRGAFPIRFNGSLFMYTPETGRPTENERPIAPRFEGGVWTQNTRLIYWPLLQSGDFDLMRPFFSFYENQLKIAQDRTSRLYETAAPAAHFTETSTFWGGLTLCMPPNTGFPLEAYTRWHWNGNLEVVHMMQQYYRYTGDGIFAEKELMPMLDAAVAYFQQRFYGPGKGNKIIGNVLETWFLDDNKVEGNAPDLVGLRTVLQVALDLKLGDAKAQENWQGLLKLIEPLPIEWIRGTGRRPSRKTVEGQGTKVLGPAYAYVGLPHSEENGETYAIFPYQVYTLAAASPEQLKLARDTFRLRDYLYNYGGGWRRYDAPQAALLGLTDEALRLAKMALYDKQLQGPGDYDTHVYRLEPPFVGYWRIREDETPNIETGANGSNALQYMLMQEADKKILLLPAWPSAMDVSFKLRGPFNSVVEAAYKGGQLTSCKITGATQPLAVEFKGQPACN